MTIVRGAHVIVACQVLRQIGVPVERELRRAGLPALIEEMPDEYVSMHAALDWVVRCSRDISLTDLGFLAARVSSLATLGRPLRQAIVDAPSGLARVGAMRQLAPTENCALVVRPAREDLCVRVACDIVPGQYHAGYVASEWLQVQAIISLVRSVAGNEWAPSEITFVSRVSPSFEARSAFPNTRFICGQPHTTVLVPAALLARRCRGSDTATGLEAGGDGDVESPHQDFVFTMRRLVRPYLGEGNPGIERAAEIAGLTVRSLQRRLAMRGTTWSDLVTDARYELACELLADRSYKILDVSMAAGYEHPQHFSRAFRQVAGISPREYRRSLRKAN